MAGPANVPVRVTTLPSGLLLEIGGASPRATITFAPYDTLLPASRAACDAVRSEWAAEDWEVAP